MQAVDWARTELGAREHWPHSLRVAVDIALAVPTPMLIVWGPKRALVFNDAYAQLGGLHHAPAPGGNVPALWPAALSACRTALDAALAGTASLQPRQALPFIRDQDLVTLEFDLHFLPLADDAGRWSGAVCVLAPALPARANAADSLRLLVVEDNPDALYLMAEMLRSFGHTVDTASHADEALAQLHQQSYDALLTDVSLPGMSGVELARAALRDQPGLSIVFASGYGDSLLRQVDFPYRSLQKPYDLEQLQAVLSGLPAHA